MSDVATQIAFLEDDHTKEHRKQIRTSLVHTHFPKLVDAGTIRYDPDRDAVESDEQATSILSVLESTAVE